MENYICKTLCESHECYDNDYSIFGVTQITTIRNDVS